MQIVDGTPSSSLSSASRAAMRWLAARWRRMLRPPRRVWPTKAGLFALGFPIAVGIAAITADNNLLFLLLGGSLGAIIVSGVMSERNLSRLSVRVHAIAEVYAGEPAELRVEFRTGRDGTLYDLELRERSLGVWRPWRRVRAPSDGAIVARLDVLDRSLASTSARRVFDARGRAPCRGFELVTRFPFGLLEKSKDLEPEVDVLVRPRRIPVPEILAHPSQAVSDDSSDARRGRGEEVLGLREREDRDDARRIHALRSLKLGRDVVLETASALRPRACIGVWNGPNAYVKAFERTLELAQAAILEWDRLGYAVGLVTLTREFEPDTSTLREMLDSLSMLECASDARDVSAPERVLWLVPRGATPDGRIRTCMRVGVDGTLSRERSDAP